MCTLAGTGWAALTGSGWAELLTLTFPTLLPCIFPQSTFVYLLVFVALYLFI